MNRESNLRGEEKKVPKLCWCEKVCNALELTIYCPVPVLMEHVRAMLRSKCKEDGLCRIRVARVDEQELGVAHCTCQSVGL